MAKKEMIRTMFNEISRRYDFLNHLLSLGIDHRWRRNFVKLLSVKKPLQILDVATGTGDLAIDLASLNPDSIIGIDIAEEMLKIGKKKVVEKNLTGMISFQMGDAEAIPFPDHSFDAVTVAFGIRNFEHLEKGLAEMKRVLKPGGVMQILEFSHPKSTPFRQLFSFYSRVIIPFVGRNISGNNIAYSYLPDSVAAFPSGKEMICILEKIGMKNSTFIPLTFGISTVYISEKPV